MQKRKHKQANQAKREAYEKKLAKYNEEKNKFIFLSNHLLRIIYYIQIWNYYCHKFPHVLLD